MLKRVSRIKRIAKSAAAKMLMTILGVSMLLTISSCSMPDERMDAAPSQPAVTANPSGQSAATTAPSSLGTAASVSTAPMPGHATNPATATSAAASPSVESNDAGRIKRVLNSQLEIDAEIVFTKLDHYPILKAEIMKFDAQKVIGALAGASRYQDKSDPLIHGPGGRFLVIEPDFTLGLGSTHVFYRNEDRSYVEPLLSTDIRSLDYNLNRFSKKDNFPFATRDAAARSILATLGKMGLNDARQRAIYALDHRTLQERELVLKEETMKTFGSDPKVAEKRGGIKFKNVWTEADDQYYLEFYWCLNGLPVYTESIDNEKENTQLIGNKIQAYYSAKGLAGLTLTTLYRATGVLEPNPRVYSLDEMLARVERHFGQLITGSIYRIERALLCYVPVVQQPNRDFLKQTFEMRPAWVFEVAETMQASGKGPSAPSGSSVYRSDLIFDAVTGQQLS